MSSVPYMGLQTTGAEPAAIRIGEVMNSTIRVSKTIRCVTEVFSRLGLGFVFAAVSIAILPSPSQAGPLLFDQNVTPDVIFGSGNANGGFTVDRNNGIELGLRAKIPFLPGVNSNGDGTYSYTLAEANPAWNFDWTVNTDINGTGLKIGDLTYLLGIDVDPGLAANLVTGDPITPSVAAPFFDHSIGDNSTLNGQGVEATNAATYIALIAANNVLQQSWRNVCQS